MKRIVWTVIASYSPGGLFKEDTILPLFPDDNAIIITTTKSFAMTLAFRKLI